MVANGWADAGGGAQQTDEGYIEKVSVEDIGRWFFGLGRPEAAGGRRAGYRVADDRGLDRRSVPIEVQPERGQ